MVTTPCHTNTQFSIVYIYIYRVYISVYRLLNTPLEQTEYTREYENVLNTAVTNGFDKKIRR